MSPFEKTLTRNQSEAANEHAPSPADLSKPSMDHSLDVAVGCLPIPDGATLKGDTLVLRFCVLLRPTVTESSDPDVGRYGETGMDPSKRISLSEWPRSVMNRMATSGGGVHMHARLDGQPQPLKALGCDVLLGARSVKDQSYREEAQAAQATWMQAFGGGSREEFVALHAVLQQEREDRLLKANPAAPAHKEASVATGSGVSCLIAREAMVPETQWMGDHVARLQVSEVWKRVARSNGPMRLQDEREDRRGRWFHLRPALAPSRPDENDRPLPMTGKDPNASAIELAGQPVGLDNAPLEPAANQSAKEIVNLPLLLDDVIGHGDKRATLTEAWRTAQRQLDKALRFERPLDLDLAEAGLNRSASDLANEKCDTARRRLLGFQSHPTLAKLTRLMVDVEIVLRQGAAGPFEVIFAERGDGDWLGEVRADFSPSSKSPAIEAALVPTRFRLCRRGEVVLFQPASRHEAALLLDPAKRREQTAIPPYALDEKGRRVRLYTQQPVTPLQLGFLELRHHIGRYRLTLFDAAQSVAALVAAGRHRDESLENGARDADVSDRLPTLRTMGIQLVDTYAAFELKSDITRTFLARKASASGAIPLPLYADDLLLGYRVDVERFDGRNRTWSSATARSVHYPDLNIPSTTARKLRATRSRDHGSIQATTRLLPSENGGDQKTAVGRQEMFVWTGDPLALPSGPTSDDLPPGCRSELGGTIALSPIDAERDFNISHDFDVDDGLSFPALRLGDGYRFVLRACFLHGGGPEFRGKGHDHLYEGCCLGRTGSAAGVTSQMPFDREESYPFAITDPVGAPDLALLASDPIVRAKSLATECPGERLDQVVLRWGGHPRSDVVQRVFIPPRVGFEMAEVQGQFDQSRANIPQGALLELDLEPVAGTWPHAVGGQVLHVKADRHGVVEEDQYAGEQRGPVTRAVRVVGSRDTPFYCDARARRVAILLSRDGVQAPDVAPTYHDAAFWSPGDSQDEALPLVLEFRLARPGFTGARFDGRPEVRFVGPSGTSIRARVLRVEVGLAEEIAVEVWCPDENADLYSHSLNTVIGAVKTAQVAKGDLSRISAEASAAISAVLALGARSGLSGVADANGRTGSETEEIWVNLRPLTGERPLDVMNDVKRLRVLAAVKQPLRPPQVRPRSKGGPALGMVRLTAVGAAERWRTWVKAAEPPVLPASAVPLYERVSELGGDVAFLHGMVDLHRPSTSSLRVELAWQDWDDEVCLSCTDGVWTHKPRARHLAHKPELAVKRADDGSSRPLSLELEGVGAGPDLSFPVGTSALQIDVILTAVSRFRHCFAEATPPKLEESESRSELARLLPATVRPPKPLVVGVPEPVSRKVEKARTAQSIVIEVTWSLRVTLAARSWFKSGLDELLAVVLKPQDLVADSSESRATASHRLAASEFLDSDRVRRLNLMHRTPKAEAEAKADPTITEKEKEEARKRRQAELARVTGWAVDPTTDAGRLESVISPAVFSGWTAKRARVPLPFHVESVVGPDTTEQSDVSIIAYEARLDAETGQRFVDVDLLPGDVDMPFLRLSVARYQPHALRVPARKGQNEPAIDLSLSPQVVLDPVPWPSMRRVELDLSTSGLVKVRVQGPAYSRRAPTGPTGTEADELVEKEQAAQEITDVPWMRVQLMRLHPETQAPTVAVDGSGRALAALVPALVSGKQGRWDTELRLPAARASYRIYIEEIEFHVASDKHSTLTEIGGVEWLETPRPFKCDIDL